MRARDAAGTVLAELRPGHPCRSTIGPIELIVGGPPLVAQVGETRWAGEDHGNGTTLVRDGAAVARVLTQDDQVSVFDPTGLALVRVRADGVHDAGGRALRPIARHGQTIVVGDVTVTGTADVMVAALLTARELAPEVRMLAACERVLR